MIKVNRDNFFMGCERHFLNPAKTILAWAAEFLEEGWHSGPLDLRQTLVVVPTRHAGRRLRERLALDAAQRGTAVLTGPVYTPARLFEPDRNEPRPIASGALSRVLWRETFRHIRQELLATLVPAASLSGSTCKALAEHLDTLRQTLCEEGYTIARFAERVQKEHLDTDRWVTLADLESAYVQVVERYGFRDEVTEKFRAAEHPTEPAGIERIVVLFSPDPPPLAIKALANLAQKMPVHVCIHADPNDSDLFDEWGRPKPARWASRPLPVAVNQIEVCDDPIAMAELVRARVAALPSPARAATVIGTSDALHAEIIEATLACEDVPVFNPAAYSALRLPVFTLLRRLLDFHKERSFTAFMELARHPYARQRLATQSHGVTLLNALDEFQNTCLPQTIEHALTIAGTAFEKRVGEIDRVVVAAIKEALAWLAPFESAPNKTTIRLSEILPAVLQEVFRGTAPDRQLVAARDILTRALDELRIVEPFCSDLNEQCDWLFEIAARLETRKERPRDAIELLGWLELAWDDTPIVLLTDMNDGLVPEIIAPNPFLSDNLRCAAGLRGNDHRFARDAHVLESIVRSRPIGNVRFFVPRRSSDGNPLKPSRLLLQCLPDELATRALYLFMDPPQKSRVLRRTPGWRLHPPLPPQPFPVEQLRITSLRDYLQDPFLFYLKHILNLGTPFEILSELDSATFGNLCHRILEAFAESEHRSSTNEDRIHQFLEQQTENLFAQRYGRNPSVFVGRQKKLVLNRMQAFAKAQAQLCAEGWEIVGPAEAEIALKVAGVTLLGRIDRVDQHRETGGYRIIDYKTSRDPQPPSETHIKRLRAQSNSYRFAVCCGNVFRWTDLQLPLYAAAWQQRHLDSRSIEVAYFALPDDVEKTQLLLWDDKSWRESRLLEEALACAERLVKRIRAGVFWPPATNRVEEPFDRIFFDDVRSFLSDEFCKAMERRAAEYDHQAGEGDGL